MWTKCTTLQLSFYDRSQAASVNFHLFPSRSEKIDSLHVSLILHGSFMAMICKYLLKRNQQKNPNDNQQTNLLWIFLGFRFRLKSKFFCLCFQSHSSQSQAAEGIKNPTDVLQSEDCLTTQWYPGILLPKLFWPVVRKKISSDREKLLKFEAEGGEFAKILRSLEQFVWTVKGQNNFW